MNINESVKENKNEIDMLIEQFLDVEKCEFYKNPKNFLALRIDGNEYKRVHLTRALPLTHPEQYISVSDMENNEIGILEDIRNLSEDNKKLVEEELESRYFHPIITDITSIKEKMGSYYLDVIIDGNKKMIAVKDISKNIKQLDDGSIILTDVDGNRFLIPDIEKINAKSRRQLSPYLY